MAKRVQMTCDRCGQEINGYDIKISSARIDLWAVGTPRSYGGQRIDLCVNCYHDFVNFLEDPKEVRDNE